MLALEGEQKVGAHRGDLIEVAAGGGAALLAGFKLPAA
jgi:hypothetical protein